MDRDPVQDALKLIETDCAEPLSVVSIAAHVGLSPFHFQRVFLRDVGETVAGYVRRRRLERAAILLAADREASLIAVALDCGFETHSAFSRAFRQHFAMTPSTFVQGGVDELLSATSDARPFLKPLGKRSITMDMDVLDLPELWLLHREQAGVVDGVFFPDLRAVGVGFAELKTKAGDALMALCGAYRAGPAGFNDAAARGHYGGLFLSEPQPDWSADIAHIAAGQWAVFAHYGPYERLHMTWNKACRNWLPANGLAMREEWMIETYLGLPDGEGARTPSAQIYLPLDTTARMEQQTG